MRKRPLNLGDMFSQLGEGINRVVLRPDANSYVPHEKQVKFHEAQGKGRLYIGGNRSGKTVAGVIEDIWWLTHRHPYRKTPEGPIRGRLVCVDFPNGWEKIVKPVITQWIPPSCLVNGSWTDSFNNRTRTLHLANGSFLEIMSYDQEVEAFAGASRHFTHFDEEPPEVIWQECRMRLLDTAGSWWISMTPVEGMEWIEDKLYEPNKKAARTGEKAEFEVDIIEVNTEENTYLSSVEIDSVFAGMEDDDIKVRKQGKFVRPGGLIYKDFNPSVNNGHVIRSLKGKRIPRNWRIISSMDHGFNNPTAWHWHAVSPAGSVVTFAEHYRPQWTVKQHADMVKQIEEEWGIVPDFRVGDPAIAQKSGINGNSVQMEYRLNGIPIILGNNHVNGRLVRVAEYIRQAKWFISEDCPKLIWELKRYRWKTRTSKKLQALNGPIDQPHKKDDHACDGTGYFFMSLPELAPREIPVDLKAEKEQIQSILNGKRVLYRDKGYTDPYVRHTTQSRPSDVSDPDEYMGGYW